MGFLVVLAILVAVVVFVSAPLRRSAGRGRAGQPSRDGEREASIAELEAAREAKLREIVDADLDHRTGKLSDADHRELDDALRTEAVDILHRLDAVRAPASEVSEHPVTPF